MKKTSAASVAPPAPMRRPRSGRQTVGKTKSTATVVSVRAIIYVAVGSSILIMGAAHFAFVGRGAGVVPDKREVGATRAHLGGQKSVRSLGNGGEDGHVASTAEHVVGDGRGASAVNRQLATADGGNEKRYHLVFSTDCSPYQHWQSYVLFYSALKIGQPGYVTRIASGCSEEDGEAEVEWHNKHIRGSMSDKFGIHLTPHFSNVMDSETGKETGKEYEFFNKPFGLRHWMENGEGMGIDPTTGKIRDEDTIVVLLDPDHIILRPFSDDFSNDDETVITGMYAENRKMRVEHGVPFGQLYGLGNKWQEFNLDVIAGPDSPAKDIPSHDADRDYPAGPPYIATARDMYQIAVRWTDTVPKVHAEYPHLLAEMYAYCIAAADRGLPHQIVESMMVSNSDMDKGEGWSFVDEVPAEEVCEYASNLDHRKHSLPNVLHHCQRYMLGKHFFGKRRLPKDFFTCESPMLIEVPGDIALKYDYRIPPPPHKPPGEKKPVKKHVAKRETFMLCAITAALNEASEFFKKHGCDGVEGTNWNKTMDLWHVPMS